mgnify:FL=1
MKGADTAFAALLLHWQAEHGRHDLPWQSNRDPYRVWLSEIMLQQTQVETVHRYYDRFLTRFPDIAALASSDLDDVLAMWSGLGYYSRARNLHRCAITVQREFNGAFPGSMAELEQLPGIGRSTAAAIASICFGERAAILDGNVRRVLSRYLGFDGDLSSHAQVNLLWRHAEELLPRQDLSKDMPRYTQAIMDLGATVCRSSRPACAECPLAVRCAAKRQGLQGRLPFKSRKLVRRAESWWLLWIQNPAGEDWLVKRPDTGIWAGLYCLPVMTDQTLFEKTLNALNIVERVDLPVVVHALTHVDLHLHPVRVKLVQRSPLDFTIPGGWHAATERRNLGLPAPIRAMLDSQRRE